MKKINRILFLSLAVLMVPLTAVYSAIPDMQNAFSDISHTKEAMSMRLNDLDYSLPAAEPINNMFFGSVIISPEIPPIPSLGESQENVVTADDLDLLTQEDLALYQAINADTDTAVPAGNAGNQIFWTRNKIIIGSSVLLLSGFFVLLAALIGGTSGHGSSSSSFFGGGGPGGSGSGNNNGNSGNNGNDGNNGNNGPGGNKGPFGFAPLIENPPLEGGSPNIPNNPEPSTFFLLGLGFLATSLKRKFSN